MTSLEQKLQLLNLAAMSAIRLNTGLLKPPLKT